MPESYSDEFRRNVIETAKESTSPRPQLAKDFGISITTLNRWLQIDRQDREGKPVTATSPELREAQKRIRALEMENEILRRASAYLSQANLRLGQHPK